MKELASVAQALNRTRAFEIFLSATDLPHQVVRFPFEPEEVDGQNKRGASCGHKNDTSTDEALEKLVETGIIVNVNSAGQNNEKHDDHSHEITH